MGLCASLPTLFPCCHTLWNADAYITEYAQPDTWYKYLDLSVNSLSLVLMIVCYAVGSLRMFASLFLALGYYLSSARKWTRNGKISTNITSTGN